MEPRPDPDILPLRTGRLEIRAFRPEDAGTLRAYRSDPEVARYQSWDAPFSAAQAARFVAEMASADPFAPGAWYQLAIAVADSGQHIGDLAVHVRGDDPRQATVGVTLATQAQGHGYATEALTVLLDHLFLARELHRVSADCDARNTAVIALLERVGLRREAHHLQSAWRKGEWTDEHVYAVLRAEWPRPG